MRLSRSFRARRPGLLADVLKTRLALETLENRTVPTAAGPLPGILTVAQPHIVPPSDPTPVYLGNQGVPPPTPPNVLVDSSTEDGNSANDTHSETALTLAGSTILAGFNDSFLASSNRYTGFARSTDGGTSFTDLGGFANTSNGDAGDPVLAYDTTIGRTYFASLAFNSSWLNVWRSDNALTTIMPAVNGAPGRSGLDKEWMAVDNFAGSGQGNVYLVVRDFGSGNGIYFFKSTNHGDSFGPSAGTLIASGSSGNVQGAWVAVGPNHAIYAFWYDSSSPVSIKMRKSTDQGATFGPAVTVTTLSSNLGVNGDLGLGGGFRSNAFPHAVVNPSNGDIYVVYDDRGAGTDKSDIYFRESTDGGTTWSNRVRVNDDTGNHDQWQPSIAVTPSGTSIGVFWYDRRLDAADNLIDWFGTVGHVSGHMVTFDANFRVSDTSFPVAIGRDPAINPVYMGDYDTAVADNNYIYTVWGDNRNPSRGHAGNHSDVRFAKIPLGTSQTATHYTVNAPAIVNAGDSFSVTVTATNDFGQPDPTYRGTVHFTSTDDAAGLPDDYTFTAADGGVHTFDGVSLNTPGNQSITGTDTNTATITGVATITVYRVGASHFTFSAPNSVITGQSFSITIRAIMDNGQVDPDYQGTVTFTSTDGSAGLPDDYTFTPDDAGVHTFDGLSLSTLGNQSITATDTSDNTITGTVPITVIPPSLFQNHVDYPVGAAPTSVAIGDFNGDGIPDLAVANDNSNDITILLGNGDGTFRVLGNIPAGGNIPNAISAGDFNGDGILDLVTANANTGGAGSVSVLLGNGDGTFAPARTYATGSSPYSAEVADLTGSGILDIIVAGFGSNSVSVLLGNGDGTFQAARNYTVGTGPAEVAIADYNSDGVPDLAVANSRSNSVTILLGNGDGTFRQGSTIAVGPGAQSVFSADFNGDGIPDLVTANTGTNTVSILLGNGDGTFRVSTATVGSSPAEVAVDDFNGDGIPDIVTANSGSSNVSVLLGNGDGSFQPQLTYAAGVQAWFVTSADLNFDGAEDLVVVNLGSNSVSILLNTHYFGPAPSGGSSTRKVLADPTLAGQPDSHAGATPAASTTDDHPAAALDPFAVDQYLGTALSGEHHGTSSRLAKLLTRPITDGWLTLLRPDELLDL